MRTEDPLMTKLGKLKKLPSGFLESVREHSEAEGEAMRPELVAQKKRIERRRPISEISDAEIQTAIESSKGLVSYAAKALNVNRNSLRKRIAESVELQEFIDAEYEAVLDVAESSVFKALSERGSIGLKAATFVLQTIGGKRGWRPKQEVQVSEQDIAIIQAAVQATLLKFVPASDQVEAKSYFVEHIKESMKKRRG